MNFFTPDNVNHPPYAIFTGVWYEGELSISYLSVKSKPDFLKQSYFVLHVHIRTNASTSKTMWALPPIHFSWKGLRGLSFKSCFVTPLGLPKRLPGIFQKRIVLHQLKIDPRHH